MRGEAGEHITSNPPYGYVKDPQNKKKWIVDEESAKVVRRIFDLCIAGKGPMQIAKILTADRVLTVTAYNARQKGWAMPDNLYRWCAKSVAGILERPEYTGCTVNFKTYTKSLKFKKRMENPKENQRIFEDTQPAIIERGQWERVQALRANKRRPTKTGKPAFSSVLSIAPTVAQSSITVPAIPTKMSLKTISSAPITRAIQVPAKSITSERLRFINGCWNVFREH